MNLGIVLSIAVSNKTTTIREIPLITIHSKRTRVRMQQIGLGSGLNTRSGNPVCVRDLRTPVTLDAMTEYHLRYVEHAWTQGVAAAVTVFHLS